MKEYQSHVPPAGNFLRVIHAITTHTFSKVHLCILIHNRRGMCHIIIMLVVHVVPCTVKRCWPLFLKGCNIQVFLVTLPVMFFFLWRWCSHAMLLYFCSHTSQNFPARVPVARASLPPGLWGGKRLAMVEKWLSGGRGWFETCGTSSSSQTPPSSTIKAPI